MRFDANGSSKFGVTSTTGTIAAEFAGRNIRVYGVAPGSIDTPMPSALPRETLDAFSAKLPMKRLGTADEIANVIADRPRPC